MEETTKIPIDDAMMKVPLRRWNVQFDQEQTGGVTTDVAVFAASPAGAVANARNAYEARHGGGNPGEVVSVVFLGEFDPLSGRKL